MNKQEYLNQLKKYLKRLPKDDYEQAMEYFTEYFEDAGLENEQRVIAELGDPRNAATEILENILDKKSKFPEQGKTSDFRGNVILIAFLAVFAAPIGVPLFLAVLMLMFAGVLITFSLFLCSLAFGIAGVLVGGKLLIRGILAIPYSVSGFCVISGMGILGIGVGILLCLMSWQMSKWLLQGLIRLVKMILRKGRERV